MRNGLAVVEAAYDLDASVPQMLRRLVEAAGDTLDRRNAIMAYQGDLAAWHLASTSVIRSDERLVQAQGEVGRMIPAAVRRAVQGGPANLLVTHVSFASGPHAERAQQLGVANMVMVGGFGSPLGSLCVIACLPTAAPPPDAFCRHWKEVAEHLSAAYSLRVRATASTAVPVAELCPDGRVRGLAASACEPNARESLRRAVLDREAARSSRRSTEGVCLWPALVEGRWSLLDSFTAAGQRRVVAFENGGPARLRALEPLERTVLENVLDGRAGKWIALDLDISEATVARLLRMALRRLGARHLAVLGRVRSALFDPIDDDLAPGPRIALARIEDVAALLGLLTTAELAVARDLVEGRSTEMIARSRGTSVRTVINQVSAIYRKAGVSSRRELIAKLG